MANPQVRVWTNGSSVSMRMLQGTYYLTPGEVNHLCRLLDKARQRADRVRAHHCNLARGAQSPWSADELRDLTHDDLEALVAADQAGSWKEG